VRRGEVKGSKGGNYIVEGANNSITDLSAKNWPTYFNHVIGTVSS